MSQLATSIQSVEDLRGKAVGTVAVYVSRLAKLGIAAAEIPFDVSRDHEQSHRCWKWRAAEQPGQGSRTWQQLAQGMMCLLHRTCFVLGTPPPP